MELVDGILDQTKVKIHYWTGGKSDAPLVVFSHGATVDHHEWDATLPLVGKDFGIMTWDIQAVDFHQQHLELQEAVNDLAGILDALKVEQAIFVGHSLGGNLHQELVFPSSRTCKSVGVFGLHLEFSKTCALEYLSP